MNAAAHRVESRQRRVLLWYPALSRAKALASCRHRIGNLAEAGSGVSLVIAERLPRDVLGRIDVLVVLRPYPTRHLIHVLGEAERRGVHRIADYDDLLFAGAAEDRPEVASGRLSRGWMEAAHRAYAGLLPAFDAFSTATEALAEELRVARPGAPVFVVPNGLSPSWVEQGRALYRRWTPGDRRVIRFFPGSPTHDASFDAIRPALSVWLHAHHDVSLEIVGNLAWDPGGFPADRVSRHAAVPYDHLPELLASSWVNLWPRAETRFNRCKSPIKFLEPAAFGCPTVASQACKAPGLECDGLIYAATDDGWRDALTHWLDDDARAHASSACMRFVDEQGGTDRSWLALDAGLSSLRGCA